MRKSILNQADLKGVEKKNRDALGTYTAPTAGVFSEPSLISGVSNGTDSVTRVGRRVLMKSINMRYSLNNIAEPGGGSSGPWPNRARILLIYDKSPNGVLPAAADILEPGAGFNSMMDLNNSDRFVVIADEMTEQNQNQTGVVGQTAASGHVYRKINMESVYGGTGNAIADIKSGAIYIMVCSDSVLDSVSATWAVNALTRIRYTDVRSI